MQNPTGLSEAMIDAVIESGWAIADTSISEQNGKKSVRVTLQIYGYLDEEYDAYATFDGTDEDFVRAAAELFDDFDAGAYSEEMRKSADKYAFLQEPNFKLCGDVIEFALNDLANDCEEVVDSRKEK